MRQKLISILLFTLFILSSCQEISIEDPYEKREESVNTMNMTQGHVRIKVTDTFSNTLEKQANTKGFVTTTMVKSSDDALSSIGVKYMQRTFPPAGRFETRTRKEGLHLWYEVYFDTQTPLTKANNELSDINGIQKVEYIPTINKTSSTAHFNDPMLPTQWHYFNDGTIAGSVAGSDINVIPVWENYTTGDPAVIVSVVDEGIDIEHEDLKDNIWRNEAEINGIEGFDDDNNGYIDDYHGWDFVDDGSSITPDNHGTHVAGTISAVNNNGKGVSGIAGGDAQKGEKGVRLMSCQIFIGDKNGSTVAAIKYGADNGAVISQNSWGYNINFVPDSDKDAIDYFVKYAGIDEHGNQTGPMRGGIVIFAAGNQNVDYDSPSMYEGVFAVASIGADYERAYYSNYGSWIDIAAPGGDENKKALILSTFIDNEYGFFQGTSMACPHVSGVAALIISQFGGTGFTPEMLKAKMMGTAKDIDKYNSLYIGKLGAGLINAYAAMTESSSIAPEAVKIFTAIKKSNSVNLSWDIPQDSDETKASSFTVYYSDTLFTSSLDRDNLPSHIQTAGFTVGNLNVGDIQTEVIRDLDFEKKYYFAIDANDYSRNKSALSDIIAIKTETNNPPILTPKDGLNVEVRYNEIARMRFECYDPDGHYRIYDLEPGSDAVSAELTGENELTLIIAGTRATAGKYKAKIIVTDQYGLSVEQIVEYTILPTTVPVIIKKFDDLVMGKIGDLQTYDLDSYFKGGAGDLILYDIEMGSPEVAQISEKDNILSITSLNYGMTNVQITASDTLNEVRYSYFRILVRDEDIEIDLYPNPVIKKLNVRMGIYTNATISIISPSGTTVVDGSYSISPFEPTEIDMSKLSAGVYTMFIKYDKKEIKRTIIKL